MTRTDVINECIDALKSAFAGTENPHAAMGGTMAVIVLRTLIINGPKEPEDTRTQDEKDYDFDRLLGR